MSTFDQDGQLGAIVFPRPGGTRVEVELQGEVATPLATIGPNGVIWKKTFLTLDTNCEYRFTRRISVFFNARNLNNALARDDRLSPRTPSYTHPRLYAERNVKMSAGSKGTF